MKSPSRSGAAEPAGLVSSGEASLRNSWLIWRGRKLFYIQKQTPVRNVSWSTVTTWISAVGLSMCRCMIPNRGSGAPSVSSIRDRASGRTASFLQNQNRILNQKNKQTSDSCWFLCFYLRASRFIFRWLFCFRSWFTTVWSSSEKKQTGHQDQFSAGPPAGVLTASHPGEWCTGGGRPWPRRTGAGRRGRGRSGAVADPAEAVGLAPAGSSWCCRWMGVNVRLTAPEKT